MAQESERPRPHGDPLEDEIVEPNRAQHDSEAPTDIVGSDMVEEGIDSGSTGDGNPPANETDVQRRRNDPR